MGKFFTIQKLTSRLLMVALLLIGSLLIYINSFEDVEPICQEKEDTKVFLLNYVTKQNLKAIVMEHSKNLTLKEENVIYLLNPILRLPNPILLDSEIDYKKKGCDPIDNMDIFCEIRHYKLHDGKMRIWYNFME